jgi:hypothetical protein
MPMAISQIVVSSYLWKFLSSLNDSDSVLAQMILEAIISY